MSQPEGTTQYSFDVPCVTRIRVIAASEEEARRILAVTAQLTYIEHEAEVGAPDTGEGAVYVAWLEGQPGAAELKYTHLLP